MIRRHLTPALLAFVALLLSCLAGPLFADRWWLVLALSLAAAAGGVTALLRPESMPPSVAARRAGVLLFGISAGLLLGAASQARMADTAARSFLPMPESDVTDITGTVVQDSSLSPEGDTVLRLGLTSAASSPGNRGARAREPAPVRAR